MQCIYSLELEMVMFEFFFFVILTILKNAYTKIYIYFSNKYLVPIIARFDY